MDTDGNLDCGKGRLYKRANLRLDAFFFRVLPTLGFGETLPMLRMVFLIRVHP